MADTKDDFEQIAGRKMPRPEVVYPTICGGKVTSVSTGDYLPPDTRDAALASLRQQLAASQKVNRDAYSKEENLLGCIKAANDRIEALEGALTELVSLKNHKDAIGKDADYERRQPIAWERAKEVLPQYLKGRE